MNKILIEVYCPSISKSFDFWLPKKIVIQKAILLILEEIKSYEKNNILFSNPKDILLFSKDIGYLNKSLTFENAGVKSGDTLIIL